MPRTLDPNKKSEILRAARLKFSEKGYNQTPMSDIAHEAGIAHGTLYLYYPAKESIAMALAEDFFDRLGSVVLPAAEQAASLDGLMHAVELALDFLEREEDLTRMLGICAQADPRQMPMPARLQFYNTLAAILEKKMEVGIVRHYEPSALAELVAGLIEWVAESSLLQGLSGLGKYRPTLLAFIHNALSLPHE